MKKTFLYVLLIFAQTFNLCAETYTLTDDDVVVEDGVIQSCSYGFSIKDIVIPETLDDQTVIGIAGSWSDPVFANKDITSVELPATIKSIGSYAFQSNKISALNLTDCKELEDIGSAAFYGNELSEIDLSMCTKLMNIGTYAFIYNNFESFTLPTLSADNFEGWADTEGLKYIAGEEATNFEKAYEALMSYTLTDEDVVVENGIIQSCSYEFEAKIITIPEILDEQTVTGIGENAFEYKYMYEITFPSSIKTIGDYAFKNNYFNALDFSNCDSLREIGSGAFGSNPLKSVDITDCISLKIISWSAFNAIDSLTMPSSSLYGDAWISDEGSKCQFGETVAYSPYYSIINEYTLTDDDVEVKDGVIVSCSYDFSANSITIPSVLDNQTIIGIADGESTGVFSGKGIQWVKLPASIETIGKGAFSVNKIKKLDLSEYPNLKIIGANAFKVNDIVNLNISENSSLTEIGANAFLSNNIESVNFMNCKTLTTIGDAAFKNNRLTDTVKLNDCINLTEIGDEAFYLNRLNTVDLSDCSSLQKIGVSAFENNYIKAVSFSNCSELNIIDEDAFNDNKIDSVNLSDCNSLMLIGSSAFDQNNMGSFVLPDCKIDNFIEWENAELSVFNAGDTITDMKTSYRASIPYTLTDDDVVVEDGIIVSTSYDFMGNNITIPEELDNQTVTGIAPEIFAEKGIRRISLPSSLQTIGNYAFESNSLTDINLEGFADLKRIGTAAFASNKIKAVDFSDCGKIQTIGYNAFVGNLIDTVDLSACNTLTTIGRSAFYSSNLDSFALPECKIENFIRWEDGKGNLQTAGATVSSKGSYHAVNAYTLTDSDVVVEDGFIVSCSYDFLANIITIPNVLDGQTVIGIADSKDIYTSPFADKYILKINLPDSIKYIGDAAFASNHLQEMGISDSSVLEHIGDAAFSMNNFSFVDFNNYTALESIGETAFFYSGIDSINLTNCPSLMNIGGGAFMFNSAPNIILPYGFNEKEWEWIDNEQTLFTSGDTVSKNYSYTVLFRDYQIKIIDQDSLPIAAARFTIGDSSYTADAQGLLSLDMILYGSHPYTISVDGKDDLSGTLIVKQASESAVEIMFATQYQATFTVIDSEGATIENATASVAGSKYYIENDTIVVGKLFPAEYTFTIRAEGYYDSMVNVTISDKNIVVPAIQLIEKPTYAVTFAVNGSEGNPLNKAKISFDGGVFLTDETGLLKLPAVEPGDYPYTISSVGYESATGTVTVSDSDVVLPAVELAVVVISTFDITFQVQDENKNLLSAATVNFNGTKYNTGSNGEINISGLEAGDYNYTVSLEGYESASGSVTVIDEDITESVLLTAQAAPVYNAKIKVENENGIPLSGATANFNGTDYTSDANGEITVPSLEAGNYDYTVSLEGYESTSGTVSLVDQDIIEGVLLTAQAAPVYNAKIKVENENGIPLSGATVNFNGTDYTSDSNGDIIVTGLEAGDYNYTVSFEGYESASGSVSVVDEDIIEGVTMSPFLHKVSIIVTDVYGDPVANASVEFDGTEYLTNSAGKVTIAGLKAGVYNYSAQADIYKLYEESVVLAGEDVDLTIKLLYKKYTATLTVIDKNGDPVVNAKVIIKNVYGSTNTAHQTDINGKVVGNDLKIKTYTFSIEADGYEYYEAEFVIADENISLTVDDLVPVTYSATLSLVDTDGNPVADAVVTIEGGKYATDADGRLTIDGLNDGNYSFTVEADGFSPADGTFTVNGQNLLANAITLEAIETSAAISFIVKDSDNKPIQNATVSIADADYSTDTNGKVITDAIKPGTYSYKINAEGYLSLNGDISIADTDIEEEVVLSPDGTAVAKTPNIQFRVYPKPAVDEIKIQIDGENISSISIISSQGSVCKHTQSGQTVNVHDLSAGLYYIQLHLEDGTIVTDTFIKL